MSFKYPISAKNNFKTQKSKYPFSSAGASLKKHGTASVFLKREDNSANILIPTINPEIKKKKKNGQQR